MISMVYMSVKFYAIVCFFCNLSEPLLHGLLACLLCYFVNVCVYVVGYLQPGRSNVCQISHHGGRRPNISKLINQANNSSDLYWVPQAGLYTPPVCCLQGWFANKVLSYRNKLIHYLYLKVVLASKMNSPADWRVKPQATAVMECK